jgi:hypothetical protein
MIIAPKVVLLLFDKEEEKKNAKEVKQGLKVKLEMRQIAKEMFWFWFLAW